MKIAKKMTPEQIKELIHALAELPCIPAVHGPASVCAPCEARKRVARERRVAAEQVLAQAAKDDVWVG